MKKIDAIVRTSQRGSEALNRGVPLLGICRGAQFINAALGGIAVSGHPLSDAGGSFTLHEKSV